MTFTGEVVNLGHVSLWSSTLDLTSATLHSVTLGSLWIGRGTLVTDQDLTVTGLLTWSEFGELAGVGGQGSLTAAGGISIPGGDRSMRNGFTLIDTRDYWTVATQARRRFACANHRITRPR